MRLWPILKASHSPLIFYYTGILVTIAKIKYCYQDINFTFYWHFERDHQDMTDLEQKKRWQMREYSEKNLSKNHLTVWYGQSSLQTSIQTYVWHLHLNYLSRIIFQIINIFSIIFLNLDNQHCSYEGTVFQISGWKYSRYGQCAIHWTWTWTNSEAYLVFPPFG